jgi:hypothetical protein
VLDDAESVVHDGGADLDVACADRRGSTTVASCPTIHENRRWPSLSLIANPERIIALDESPPASVRGNGDSST